MSSVGLCCVCCGLYCQERIELFFVLLSICPTTTCGSWNENELYRFIYLYVWFPVGDCLERIRRCSIVGGGVTGTNSRFQKSSVLGPLPSLCGSEVSSPTAPGYLLPVAMLPAMAIMDNPLKLYTSPQLNAFFSKLPLLLCLFTAPER